MAWWYNRTTDRRTYRQTNSQTGTDKRDRQTDIDGQKQTDTRRRRGKRNEQAGGSTNRRMDKHSDR